MNNILCEATKPLCVIRTSVYYVISIVIILCCIRAIRLYMNVFPWRHDEKHRVYLSWLCFLLYYTKYNNNNNTKTHRDVYISSARIKYRRAVISIPSEVHWRLGNIAENRVSFSEPEE